MNATKSYQQLTFLNKCMLFFARTKPTASLFSRKQGLGIPIHIKTSFLLIDIDSYTLLVLGGSIILPLLLIHSWALAIAYLPIAFCLCLSLCLCLCLFAFAYARAMGRAHAPRPCAGAAGPSVEGQGGRPQRGWDGLRGPSTWGGAWARAMAWA